jgi:hypothetical protein
MDSGHTDVGRDGVGEGEEGKGVGDDGDWGAIHQCLRIILNLDS